MWAFTERWLGVIVVRPAPCPSGQQIDILGLCRPVVSRAAPPPLPALFISQYGQSYRDLDPLQPRRRPTRLARPHSNVIRRDTTPGHHRREGSVVT